MNETTNLVVGIPLYQNCTLMDFAGATQVFSSYGFETIWIAQEREITTTENITVVANYNFTNHPPFDILLVPGGGSEGVSAKMFDPEYLDFLRKNSQNAWAGSVCTGAFICTAAGLFDGFEGDDVKGITTYWSQIPNLSLLKDKYNFPVADGYFRFTFDSLRKRFSGGGISSSVDLALNLAEVLKGKDVAEKIQLFIQYAPDPPNKSGDPGQAPPGIVQQVSEMEAGFTGAMYDAVEKLLNQ